jgi:hypothetical protein
MNCAPFRVERSRIRLPLFPSRKACAAVRLLFGEADCVCRAYPGEGFYVIGACGHAHGWDMDRTEAIAQARRLATLQEAS